MNKEPFQTTKSILYRFTKVKPNLQKKVAYPVQGTMGRMGWMVTIYKGDSLVAGEPIYKEFKPQGLLDQNLVEFECTDNSEAQEALFNSNFVRKFTRAHYE